MKDTPGGTQNTRFILIWAAMDTNVFNQEQTFLTGW